MNFDSLYSSYAGKVSGYIHEKHVPAADAQDVHQEIFKKIAQRLPTFDPKRADAGTWVYVISRSCVADYFRKQRGVLSLDADSDSPNAAPLCAHEASVSGAEETTVKREELDCLAEALAELSLRERQIIVLHYYSDIPINVIAKRLGITSANARMIKTRALRKLQELLKNTVALGSL